jgi:thiol:disulfide interchange protein DsbA
MNRGIVVVTALAAAAIGATFSMRACAATPTPAATTSIGEWQAGTNYTLLESPLPPHLAKGKIEVNEIFWYGCSHCYALDPTLESWKTSKPGYVEFVRIPVIWGPMHRQHAKLFYTLQALGRGDLHPKVFEAIHRDGKPLAAQDEQEARAMHWEFLKQNGVSEKDFNAAYDSPAVAANVAAAEQLTLRFAVASVPLMIVNGKYSTSVSQAGGQPELLTLVNALAASEKSR